MPNRTQTDLNKLGIFRSVNLGVTPLDSLRGSDTLDVAIDAQFDYPLEAALETDVTSKSNSFIGPGITFKVSNNNLFRGGRSPRPETERLVRMADGQQKLRRPFLTAQLL